MSRLSRLTLTLAALAVLAPGAPAWARIVCKDGFQATRDGGWISTPYCNDEHLAEIGRAHGMKVTGAQVRADFSRRSELCRLVGSSPSARDYCPLESPEGRGR